MTATPRGMPFLPASTILLLVAGLGGAVWYSQPLKSFRPVEHAQWAMHFDGQEHVPARLWQDPFLALHNAKLDSTEHQKLKPTPKLVLREGDWVMPVMVPGGSHAESVEQRMRIRYAVVAGLAAEGYLPRVDKAIGFIPIPRTGHRVPFEWYGNDDRTRVLLIWVDEDAAGTKPLLFIHELHPQLARCGVDILGPASSNTLLRMMKELSRTGNDRWQTDGLEWRIFNFRATAPESVLLEEVANADETARAKSSGKTDTVAQWILRHGGIHYERLLCTDDQLMSTVLAELALRGVDLTDQKSAIAFVSEFDTLYGRSFSLALQSAMTDTAMQQILKDEPNLPEAEIKEREEEIAKSATDRIWHASYLRGLDGVSPHAPDSDHEEQDRETQDGDEAEWHQPTGQSQLDYLRRLGKTLQRRSHRSEDSKVVAVGILGSDVYDKQLALQALRPEFSDALFFTTDLDARLLHHSQYDWTRNLIIASAYGLELRPKFQGVVPPFRDSYQTAAYAATRRALTFQKGRKKSGVYAAIPPAPRVYEVGRSGAWDLSPEDFIHPKPPASERTGPWRYFPLLVVMLLIFWVLSSTVLGRVHNLWRGSSAWMKCSLFCGLGLITASFTGWITLALLWPEGSFEEPFALFEGISIWPTETIRAFVFLFSIAAILVGIARLRSNADEIEHEFGVKPLKPIPGGWSWSFGMEQHSGPVDGAALWSQYCGNFQESRMVARICPMFLVYLALYLPMFFVLGMPFVPARGLLVHADPWIFGLTAFAFSILLLFVQDATRECSSLIHRLSNGPTAWPRDSRELQRLGMHYEDVADVLDIRLIARRTKAVGKLVLGPFFALFLLVISRNHYFDNWNWPLSLVFVLTLQGALALGAALRMRQQAERARHIAIRNMTDRVTMLTGAGEEARARQVEQALAQTRELRDGAFGPWFQSPAVQALLMPFGGVGAIALIDLVVQSG